MFRSPKKTKIVETGQSFGLLAKGSGVTQKSTALVGDGLLLCRSSNFLDGGVRHRDDNSDRLDRSARFLVGTTILTVLAARPPTLWKVSDLT
jgi:hypothetical protein